TSAGVNVIGKEKGYGQKQVDDFTKLNYHRPSDEYNANTWKLDGAIDDLQLLFKVGLRMAFGQLWPGWKTGSEFKAIRDKK
ncbi:MAG: peptidase M28, partial [Ferruginibacter sp.]